MFPLPRLQSSPLQLRLLKHRPPPSLFQRARGGVGEQEEGKNSGGRRAPSLRGTQTPPSPQGAAAVKTGGVGKRKGKTGGEARRATNESYSTAQPPPSRDARVVARSRPSNVHPPCPRDVPIMPLTLFLPRLATPQACVSALRTERSPFASQSLSPPPSVGHQDPLSAIISRAHPPPLIGEKRRTRTA